MTTQAIIEVYIFKTNGPKKTPLFLLMKRTEERGGFWQPLTGKVEYGETKTRAIEREVGEETGIVDFLEIYDPGYAFYFKDKKHSNCEHVFGLRVADDTKVKLSDEHETMTWTNFREATKKLAWEENRRGLKLLNNMIGQAFK